MGPRSTAVADVEEIDTAVEFDTLTCRWRVLGETTEVRRADERRTCQRPARGSEPTMGLAAIATATGMSDANVRQLLKKMVEKGEVMKVRRGRYAHPDRSQGDHNHTPHHNDHKITNSTRRMERMGNPIRLVIL